jgi:hypothetical protein
LVIWTVLIFGSKVFANSSRDWTRSVRTIGVHPAAWAARAVTRPIGPAPLFISQDLEGIPSGVSVEVMGWGDPVILPQRRSDTVSRRGKTLSRQKRGRTRRQQDHLISHSPFQVQQEQQPMVHTTILLRKTCCRAIYGAKLLDGRGIG